MQQKDRKQMYRQQTMGYFINAALEIIEEEGIDSLSIRKTAEKAGYNSATLYHYFSDFEELRIFSAMKYLDQYAKDLPAYLEPVTRPLERYLKIWECFCLHSFSHPDIFWLLFFKHADTNWDFSYYFHAYYDIFPESWSEDAANYTKAGYLTEPFKIFHLRDEHKLNIDFHYHDFHKILIHLHGNVSYCIEGRSYELKEHDIVLVNAGEVHKPILNNDSIYERIIIYVSPQLIDDYVSKGYDLACCFKQAYANQSHVLRLAATKGSRLADTIKGLDSTLRETNEYANELYQKLLFLEFLIQLNRITLHGGIEYINTFSSNKKIVEILDFLNKNLTNRISIDELADKFYMSRYHLMHTFKEETGCTIGSYITTKRLLLARDMIRDGSSVSAACDACGFGSYSSFIRAYRKQFHSTPTNT